MGDEELASFEHSEPLCSIVSRIPYEDRCNFTMTTEDCESYENYVNYIQIIYCIIKPKTDLELAMGILMLFVVLLFMFLLLGTVADYVFCPALMVLSKKMGMNEHLAGVTLLAFGNGAPDCFTSWIGWDSDSQYQYSDLLGSAIYVFSFVGGLILVMHPFRLNPNNIVRDTLFFILAVLCIDFSLKNMSIVTIYETIAVISIYFIYIFVVIFDQWLIKKQVRDMRSNLSQNKRSTMEDKERLEELRSEADIDIISRVSGVHIDTEETRKKSHVNQHSANDDITSQVWITLNPINAEDWEESGCFGKSMMVLKAPILLVINFFIPLVDMEMDRHGWSKLLNALQVITFPFFAISLLFGFPTLYGVPVVFYTMILTIPFSIYTLITSRTDLPPPYHFFWVIYSAVGSVVLIYSTANEAVNILSILGLVTERGNAFMGTTLLAYGNGIGDLAANTALAKNGYNKMAFAACIGSPLFNAVLAMGGTLFLKCFNSPTWKVSVSQGPYGENCLTFILIILVGTLTWALSTDFRARRVCGIFSLTMYSVFLLLVILGEMELIKTLSSEEEM